MKTNEEIFRNTGNYFNDEVVINTPTDLFDLKEQLCNQLNEEQVGAFIIMLLEHVYTGWLYIFIMEYLVYVTPFVNLPKKLRDKIVESVQLII